MTQELTRPEIIALAKEKGCFLEIMEYGVSYNLNESHEPVTTSLGWMKPDALQKVFQAACGEDFLEVYQDLLDKMVDPVRLATNTLKIPKLAGVEFEDLVLQLSIEKLDIVSTVSSIYVFTSVAKKDSKIVSSKYWVTGELKDEIHPSVLREILTELYNIVIDQVSETMHVFTSPARTPVTASVFIIQREVKETGTTETNCLLQFEKVADTNKAMEYLMDGWAQENNVILSRSAQEVIVEGVPGLIKVLKECDTIFKGESGLIQLR